MPHDRPPEPWHSFFLEIDKTLDRPVALHCIGGFAIAMLYGLPRPTVDVDCLTVIRVEKTAPSNCSRERDRPCTRSTEYTYSMSTSRLFPRTMPTA